MGRGSWQATGRREPGVCPALLAQAGGAGPAGSCSILEEFLNYLLAEGQRPLRIPSPGSEASPPPLSSPCGPTNLLQWPVPVLGDPPCSPQPHVWKWQSRAHGEGAPSLWPLPFFLPGLACHLLRSGRSFLSSGNPHPSGQSPQEASPVSSLLSGCCRGRWVGGSNPLQFGSPDRKAFMDKCPYQKHNLSEIY